MRAHPDRPGRRGAAPSAWAFVVVQDRDLLRRYGDRAKAIMLESGDAHARDPAVRQLLSDPACDVFYGAGTLIVICARPVGPRPELDCALAAENLMLAAHDLGLATCPIGFAWALLDQPDVRQELAIPPDCKVVLPIIVGRPRGAAPPASPRRGPDVLSWRA